MESTLKVYSTFLLFSLLLSSTVSASNDPKVEKKKTYNKSYTVSGSDKISFDNRFGKLKINTWDKNEVKVEVIITAKANSEERAQIILDHITIQDSKNGSGVSFKTKLDDEKRNWSKGDKDKYSNEGFDIDYDVYLPGRNTLDAHNEFGETEIPDYPGEITIETKFGSLTTGKLSNPKKVTVEFGTANIESISNGDLTIKFSRAIINKLDGNVKASFEHCSGVKLNIDNNIKDLNVRNNFTTLYLDLNKNLSANFDIYSNFGEVSNRSSFDISKEDRGDERGPKFDSRYSGKAGGGNSPMRIRSEFGHVVLGHNLNMDLKEEKGKKKKERDI